MSYAPGAAGVAAERRGCQRRGCSAPRVAAPQVQRCGCSGAAAARHKLAETISRGAARVFSFTAALANAAAMLGQAPRPRSRLISSMEATLKDKNGVAKEAWVFVLLQDTVMVSIDRQLEKAAGMGILDACIAALTTAISAELLSEAEGRFFPIVIC